MHLTQEKIQFLESMANDIRQSIITMLVSAGSGHTAGPLGMADIFTVLYFHTLRHDPKHPSWPDRDRLVLSNGHICPVYYATLAHAGYFPVEELQTLRKFGTRLQGHPHRDYLPYVETSSGPLGSGLSQAVGMAIAMGMQKNTPHPDPLLKGEGVMRRVYCLMSDGEHDEGNTWEAIMLAGREKLHNLTAIVDRNNIQIDGFTEDIMPIEPLADKWRAFNWHVIEIDGHNMEMIDTALREAHAVFEKPTVIIAHTIPGRGVPEFEHDFRWHGKPPDRTEGEQALRALRTWGGQVEPGHGN